MRNKRENPFFLCHRGIKIANIYRAERAVGVHQRPRCYLPAAARTRRLKKAKLINLVSWAGSGEFRWLSPSLSHSRGRCSLPSLSLSCRYRITICIHQINIHYERRGEVWKNHNIFNCQMVGGWFVGRWGGDADEWFEEFDRLLKSPSKIGFDEWLWMNITFVKNGPVSKISNVHPT